MTLLDRAPKSLIISLIVGSFALSVISLMYVVFFPPTLNGTKPEELTGCISDYLQHPKGSDPDVDLLYRINGFCYNSQGSQLLLDEEVIRRDNFVFQRHENTVLLLMVVAITLSGVLLAGLQLLASYKLALLGRGELATGTEVSASRESVSLKSAVVGLAILAISFAFFIVFVIDVYALKENRSGGGNSSPGINALQASAPRPLLPVAASTTGSAVPPPEPATVHPPVASIPIGAD
jgi:hypothetical protein